MPENQYLPRDVGSWRGLLDPIRPRDREGPRFGENARPGSGFNLLAQGLAQGYSPPIASYFNPLSFQSNGAASFLSRYAPGGVTRGNATRDWEDNIRGVLNRAGMRTPGFTPGGADANPTALPADNAATPADPATGSRTLNPWQQWAQSLSPEQRAMIGGDQGNNDFRASLTPEQIQLQAAARAWRDSNKAGQQPANSSMGSADPQMGIPENLQALLQMIMGGQMNLGNLGMGGG